MYNLSKCTDSVVTYIYGQPILDNSVLVKVTFKLDKLSHKVTGWMLKF